MIWPTIIQSHAQASPFAIRGIKGLWWQGPENYHQALPWLARHRMNFLMLCYTSWPASAQAWRSDFSAAELAQLKQLAKEAQALNVILCYSFNPGIWSQPPLAYSSEADYQLALKKVKAVHATGIRSFALCLDDINRELLPEDQREFGSLQQAQVYFVNRLYRDMQGLTPRPTLIFCPSAYTTRDARSHLDYITTVGAEINRAVMMFWTGPEVCSPSITAADAREFGTWIKRKPLLWDNYPVNDMYPWRPLLAPFKNRAPDLASELTGYMSNPMKQWEISKLPLATLASYFDNPTSYKPAASLARAIENYPSQTRPALNLLITLYGSSFWGETNFPPQPRPKTTEEAQRLLPQFQSLRTQLLARPELKAIWMDVQPTLEHDLKLLELIARPRPSPLSVFGHEFEGGAKDHFGFLHYDYLVNYVYARATGKDVMRATFDFKQAPTQPLTLRLTARSDDSTTRPKIRITLNEATLFEGRSPFSNAAFEAHTFAVPATSLRVGKNTLIIQNLEETGPLGMPPWFMVHLAELVPLPASR